MITIIAATAIELNGDDATALTTGESSALIDLQLRVAAAMAAFKDENPD